MSAYSIRHLEASVESFCSLETSRFPSSATRFNTVVAKMHELCAGLDYLESEGAEEELLKSAVAPAVELQAKSPFVQRLQMRPRGYAGDFETIEYILDGRNRAPPNTLAAAIEDYALNAAPAWQHRSKVNAQANALRRICTKAATPPHILMIAAGSGPDIQIARDALQASHARIVVNDADPDAISLCKGRFAALGAQMTFLTGNALKLQREFARYGPYELIVAGGLFDYVPTSHLRGLISRLLQYLAPGSGRLFFTNIATGNPYRSWMKYFANWDLIERDENELRILFADSGRGVHLDIARDQSGLALLVEALSS